MSKKNANVDGLDEGGMSLFANILSAATDEIDNEVVSFNSFESDSNVKLIDLDLLNDAPDDWNFFEKLPDSKFQSMKDSIMEDGLFHPIFVWEVEEGKEYMILSGHNRRRAFQELYLETSDDKYKKISCKVIRTKTMNKDKARGMVSMANYAQRNVSAAEEFEALKAIFLYNREELNIKKISDNYNKIEEITGKDFSTIKRILNLRKLIPELYTLVCEDKKVNWLAAQKLVPFDEDTQRWIYDNFKDILNSKNVTKLRKYMERDTIQQVLEGKESVYKGVDIYIPKSLESDVKKLVREWEKSNKTVWEFENR